MKEYADLLTGLHAEPGMHDREWQVVNATGHRICYVQAFSEDEAIYLARSIVRAVNSHEELLAAGDSLAEVVLSLLEGEEHSDQQLDELRDSWLAARQEAKAEEGKA